MSCSDLFDRFASAYPDAPARRIPDPDGAFINDRVERPICRTCGGDVSCKSRLRLGAV